jgi:hypothetical protein
LESSKLQLHTKPLVDAHNFFIGTSGAPKVSQEELKEGNPPGSSRDKARSFFYFPSLQETSLPCVSTLGLSCLGSRNSGPHLELELHLGLEGTMTRHRQSTEPKEGRRKGWKEV